jgi:hypothetical protein
VGNSICTPPEEVVLYSGPGETVNGKTYPSTITTGADGSVHNSLYVSWTQPNDQNVVSGGHLEVQWQKNGDTLWTAFGKLDPSAADCFIGDVSDGVAYNIQVRAVNCVGVPSSWVLAGPVTVSDTYSVISYSGIAVAPDGTLSAQGLSDGTAQITAIPFTPSVYPQACTPTPATLTGLNQSQLYYVYYVDPYFAGGVITPIATQNIADFRNRAGYLLIGSITTPSYTPRYQPSTYSELGTTTTVSPSAAYDNNVATSARVNAGWWPTAGDSSIPIRYTDAATSTGDCLWGGFPAVVSTSALTLHVIASAAMRNCAAMDGEIVAKIAGTSTSLGSFSGSAGVADHTLSIPVGTDLSTVTVEIVVNVTPPSMTYYTGTGQASIEDAEIYIQ